MLRQEGLHVWWQCRAAAVAGQQGCEVPNELQVLQARDLSKCLCGVRMCI